MDDTDIKRELALLKAQAEIELSKLESSTPAKEIAGKAIGKHGLAYITAIVVIGVGSSIVLENEKIAAVMGLLGASLTALISMLNSIAGTAPKQEKPEFEVIKNLIEKLEKASAREPMKIDVSNEKVVVTKGDDNMTSNR